MIFLSLHSHLTLIPPLRAPLYRLLALDTSLAATIACLLAVSPSAPPSSNPISLMDPDAMGQDPLNPLARAATASTNTSNSSLSSTSRLLHLLRVGSDQVTVRERHRGVPGERLTDGDAALVELRPFRVYRMGEVVAYDAAAASAASAVVSGDGDDGAAQEGAGELGGGLPSDLRYATVVSCDQDSAEEEDSPGGPAAAGQTHAQGQGQGQGVSAHGVRRVALKGQGGRSLVLLSTSVYSFRAGREARAAGATATPAGAAAGGSPPPRQPRPDATASPRPALAPARLAPVSIDEVLGALQSLHRRAGLPLSLDLSSLTQRLLQLQADAARLEADLASERALRLAAQDRLQHEAGLRSCQVCFGNEVSKVLVPCGHTVCEACMGQLRGGGKCPFCRTHVAQWVSLFLPESQGASPSA